MADRDPSGFSRSPFNPAVEASSENRRFISLHDLTLREGEQRAQVAFSPQERVEIARELSAAGVPRIQMGYAGRDDEAVAAAKSAGVRAELSALCVTFNEGWRRAIDSAAEAGLDVILLLFRASDEQLAMIDFTREQGLARVREAVEYALPRIGRVVFQPSFATVADLSYLVEMCRDAVLAGAYELAPCDTTGVVGPEGAARLVQRLREAVEAPIWVHFHDDYGLALANSLAAVQAGADGVEVSVLGMGERAGNCALEEIAMALEGLYGLQTGVKLDHLTHLARFVAERAGVQIGPAKAIVGGDVFTQKLDMHVRVTSRQPWLHEPFDPAIVGQGRALKLGRGSGPHAVRAKLAELGLKVPEEQIDALVEFVNRQAVVQKDSIRDEQLIAEAQSMSTATPSEAS
jgi:isopropylmalate/homocitrate/citramalate synthase